MAFQVCKVLLAHPVFLGWMDVTEQMVFLEPLACRGNRVPEASQDHRAGRARKESLHMPVCFQRDRRVSLAQMEYEDRQEHRAVRETLDILDRKGRLVLWDLEDHLDQKARKATWE